MQPSKFDLQYPSTSTLYIRHPSSIDSITPTQTTEKAPSKVLHVSSEAIHDLFERNITEEIQKLDLGKYLTSEEKIKAAEKAISTTWPYCFGFSTPGSANSIRNAIVKALVQSGKISIFLKNF